jgi:hypothetical protein
LMTEVRVGAMIVGIMRRHCGRCYKGQHGVS